jgi:hypothetical protein
MYVISEHLRNSCFSYMCPPRAILVLFLVSILQRLLHYISVHCSLVCDVAYTGTAVVTYCCYCNALLLQDLEELGTHVDRVGERAAVINEEIRDQVYLCYY